MHYIRFLKTPKLIVGRGSNPYSIKTVLTVTNDLGDSFYSRDLLLVARAISIEEVGQIPASAETWGASEVSWLPGMRSVAVDITLKRSYDNSSCQIHVGVRPQQLFEQTHISGSKLVMPVVVPVLSCPLSPKQNIFDAEKASFRHAVPGGDDRCAVREDTAESIARHIWDASIALVAMMCASHKTPPTSLPSLDDALSGGSSVNVIELGTGCGLVGCALACTVPNCKVLLTDLSEAEPLASFNAKAARFQPGSGAIFEVLDWDKPLPPSIKQKRFHLVIAADCIYNADSCPPLVRTIRELAGGSPPPLVVIATKTRHPSESIFFELMTESGLSLEDATHVLAPAGAEPHDLEEAEKIGIYTFCARRAKPTTAS